MGKSIQKTFHMTEEDWVKCEEDMETLGIRKRSELLQYLIRGDIVKAPEMARAVGELNHAIGKIGTNINQITRNNNSYLYSEEDKRQLMDDMKEILKRIDSLEVEMRSGIWQSRKSDT